MNKVIVKRHLVRDFYHLEPSYFIFDFFMLISSFVFLSFFVSGGINQISNRSSGGFPTTSTGPSRSSILCFAPLSSVFLVMIHVEAYMFTLHSPVKSHYNFNAAAAGCSTNSPVDTCPRQTSCRSLGAKPQFLEHRDVPRS